MFMLMMMVMIMRGGDDDDDDDVVVVVRLHSDDDVWMIFRYNYVPEPHQYHDVNPITHVHLLSLFLSSSTIITHLTTISTGRGGIG